MLLVSCRFVYINGGYCDIRCGAALVSSSFDKCLIFVILDVFYVLDLGPVELCKVIVVTYIIVLCFIMYTVSRVGMD